MNKKTESLKQLNSNQPLEDIEFKVKIKDKTINGHIEIIDNYSLKINADTIYTYEIEKLWVLKHRQGFNAIGIPLIIVGGTFVFFGSLGNNLEPNSSYFNEVNKSGIFLTGLGLILINFNGYSKKVYKFILEPPQSLGSAE